MNDKMVITSNKIILNSSNKYIFGFKSDMELCHILGLIFDEKNYNLIELSKIESIGTDGYISIEKISDYNNKDFIVNENDESNKDKCTILIDKSYLNVFESFLEEKYIDRETLKKILK